MMYLQEICCSELYSEVTQLLPRVRVLLTSAEKYLSQFYFFYYLHELSSILNNNLTQKIQGTVLNKEDKGS